MPLDPSIYGNVRQFNPGLGPLELYGGALKVRALMGQGDLQDLQLAEAKREAEASGRVRDLFSRGGSVRPEEVMAIDPKSGLTYQKQLLEGQKAEADLLTKDRENFIAFADEARKRLPTIRTQADWAAYRDEQHQRAGMFLTPQMRQLAMRGAQAMPVQFDPNYVRDTLVKADELFTPKPQALGGKMVDTNPFTNPSILGQEVGPSPEARLTDKREREQFAEGAEKRRADLETARLQQEKLREEIAGGKATKEGIAQSYSTAIGTLDRLVTHPGFRETVGATLQPGKRFVPGTDAADFDAELTAFKSQVFLPMVQNLRGMGALSDAEGKKLSDAVGALTINMSEKAFTESVARIKKDLEAARQRVTPAGPVSPGRLNLPASPLLPPISAPGAASGGIRFLGFEQPGR